MRLNKFSLSLFPLLLLLTVVTNLSAQEADEGEGKKLIGKEVMTIKWLAEFKLEKKVVNRVDLGRVFRIDNEKSGWLHVMGKSGWIAARDTVPVDEALLHFNVELRRADDDKKADAYHNRGLCYNGLEDFDKAIADFEKAISLDDEQSSYYNSLGFALHRHSNYKEALKQYNKAIDMNEKNAPFLSNRGILYRDIGKYEQAMEDFAKAIKLSPYLALAYNARAWLQATCPDEEFVDSKKAIRDAKRACNYTNWRDDIPIGTLAAAYARAEDFEQAVDWLDTAKQINPHRFQKIRDDMKKQFDAEKPYIDEPQK